MNIPSTKIGIQGQDKSEYALKDLIDFRERIEPFDFPTFRYLFVETPLCKYHVIYY